MSVKLGVMLLLPDAAVADRWAALVDAAAVLGSVDGLDMKIPHLTLLYVGKVPEEDVPRARDGMLAALRDARPPTVEGRGIATFPAGDDGVPLIIDYGTGGPLADMHDALLAKIGAEAEQFPMFHAHTTLAYLAQAPTDEQLAALQAAPSGRVRWTAAAVVLMADGEVVGMVDLEAPVTDFPVPGGRDAVTLGASRFPLFDPAFAAALEEHDLWSIAGGVDGDEAAALLQTVAGRGGMPEGDDEFAIVRARETWAAAHTDGADVAAVVEAVKWLVVLPIGEAAMKATIEEAKRGPTGRSWEVKMADGTRDGVVERGFFTSEFEEEREGADGVPVKVKMIAATTADPDRYDDVVDQDTLKWVNWVAAGAPILYCHDSGHGPRGGVVVGGAKPETVGVKLVPGGKKAMVFEPEWDNHPSNPDGQRVANQWGRFLKAVSIGFRPGKGSVPRSSLPKDHYAYKADGYGMFYMDCEILEVSVVPVPANPYATQVEMGLGGERGGAAFDLGAALAKHLEDPANVARIAEMVEKVRPPAAVKDWLDPS